MRTSSSRGSQRAASCRPALAAALLLAGAASLASATGRQPPQDVPWLGPLTLQVDASDLDHRVLRVHESLPVEAGPLVLLYPEWIPGNHAPTNEVRRLAGLRIEAGGQRVAWRRSPDDFHAIELEVPAGATRLELDFQQLLPAQPTQSDPVMTRQLLMLEWQGAVLYPAGHATARIDVDPSLKLPAGWTSGSALRPAAGAADGADAADAGGAQRFERVSLETLIDSPVLAGHHFKRVALDAGVARPVFLDIAADDPASLACGDEALDAHRHLVQQADRLFGARHFAHYDVLLVLGEDDYGLGLEHHQSSENGVKGGYCKDWPKNSFTRYIVPHEFVHSWNGKFRRPADLWAADFNTTTRNSLLWVYEGQTQYWGDVLSVRSGMVPLADMRERLARRIAYLQHGEPGRRWRSLQSTTDDEIVIGRKSTLEWDSWTRGDDYYDEGALIWLDVDTRLRELSGGRRSLDDFARAFFGIDDGRVTPRTYTFDDVVDTLAHVQPFDWAGYLRGRLDTVDAGVPVEGIERGGWRLAWSDHQTDYGKSVEAYSESASFRYSLGLVVGKENRIVDVTWESPAFRAGLAAGLELVAVDAHAYKADLLREAITAAKTGPQEIQLLVKEGSEYRTVRFDYHDGLRYPILERIPGRPDLLTAVFAPR